jgi:glycosyltransferase involved in cell wall biosynthesis
MRVAAVILTFNESRRLRDCLESVRWADEIVVVDGFSTDDTVAIAKEFTEKVLLSDRLGPNNPGGYSEQRNFALQNVTAPWAFFIDADERCSPELAAEIRSTLADQPAPDVSAYQIRRKEFFFGVHSPYTHGSGWLVRLVRTGQVKWNDRLVHEGIATSGTVRELQGALLHYSKDSMADYLASLNRYTSLEAQELAKQDTPLSRRPLLQSFRTFCNMYIYKGAYREGAFGLIMSVFMAGYTFQTWAKHWESEMKSGRLPATLPRFRALEFVAAAIRSAWTMLRPPRKQ